MSFDSVAIAGMARSYRRFVQPHQSIMNPGTERKVSGLLESQIASQPTGNQHNPDMLSQGLTFSLWEERSCHKSYGKK